MHKAKACFFLLPPACYIDLREGLALRPSRWSLAMNEQELEAAIRTTIEGGQCHVILHALVKTEDAADRLISALEILKPLLTSAQVDVHGSG
jgi:hypothetical protein